MRSSTVISRRGISRTSTGFPGASSFSTPTFKSLNSGRYRTLIRQVQATLLYERHCGDDGDGFGHRRNAENGIAGHGRAGFAVAIAEGFEIADLSLTRDENNGTGDFLLVDAGLESGGDCLEGSEDSPAASGDAAWRWPVAQPVSASPIENATRYAKRKSPVIEPTLLVPLPVFRLFIPSPMVTVAKALQRGIGG
jgi:hypothetical protein